MLGKLDVFTTRYLDTMFWASTCSDGERDDRPLGDLYGPEDIDAEGLAEILQDCHDFQEANSDDIGVFSSRAGHDFFLTRNGHGAGFWDGDWPEGIGKRLAEASKVYGTQGVMAGDDGLLHVHG